MLKIHRLMSSLQRTFGSDTCKEINKDQAYGFQPEPLGASAYYYEK